MPRFAKSCQVLHVVSGAPWHHGRGQAAARTSRARSRQVEMGVDTTGRDEVMCSKCINWCLIDVCLICFLTTVHQYCYILFTKSVEAALDGAVKCCEAICGATWARCDRLRRIWSRCSLVQRMDVLFSLAHACCMPHFTTNAVLLCIYFCGTGCLKCPKWM